MSSNETPKNDETDEGGNDRPLTNQNPYGGGQPQPPTNSPYGAPQPPPQGSPYGAPQSSHGAPYSAPQSPYLWSQNTPNGQPQNAPQGDPYAYNLPPSAPAAGGGGFTIFGLTWEKNIIPNPATNGAPPVSEKSSVIAYVLWFFLGFIGLHQFYLGNMSRGLFNLVLAISIVILSMFIPLLSIAWTAYWIYEAVTLNDQTQEVNNGYLRKSIL